MKHIAITLSLLAIAMTAEAQSRPDTLISAGAKSTVTRERMNKGLVTNSLEALTGQAAGVQVQTGGNQEAMLSAVRVRGTTSLTGGNDPLVVIDGVQSDIQTLSTIYPADIDTRFIDCYHFSYVYDWEGKLVTDRTGQPLKYEPEKVLPDLTGSPYLETAGARMYKYSYDLNSKKDGKLIDNDIVLFRYADVLLMRAECKLRIGEDGSGDFNAVRERSYAEPRKCTLDNILDERLLELCWEGWRRPDLIRFNRYKSLYEGPGAIDESDGHTKVFPIPAEVRALNKNLTQNPGY